MNLYQDVLFKNIDRLRGRRNIDRLRALRRSQFWGRDKLRAWQLERLNKLLSTAREHSPFYVERLRDLRLPLESLDELAAVSPLRKDEIREERERIKTRHLPAERYGLSHTGGSTGEPTWFYLDKVARDWNRGTVYRSAEWAGTQLGRRAVDVSGSLFDRLKASTWRKRVADAILRHRHVSLVAPRSEDFDALRRLLLDFRPDSMWGYTSGIVGLAEHLEAHAPNETFPALSAVVTSSETLLPHHRDLLERVFGARRLFDHYGSREMYIAAQCSAHDGYHLHSEVVLVEIVNSEGSPCAPGEPGRVLVTDLFNHAFPFVRYEIGDIAVLAEDSRCPCGVTLPKLERVEGRIPDMVVVGDRVLTPPNFATTLAEIRGVRWFQVRQERADHIRILVEADERFDDATRDRVHSAMTKLVGGQATIEVVTDEPIEVPPSGKRRFVVSNIAESNPRQAA